MARARTIKGEAFRHEGLGELSPLHRWLFAGLWTIADREGRLEDRPRRIKIEVLPWDDCDCDRLLSDLEAAGFIVRYEADGKRAIAIPSWREHQHPHPKEQPSTIPAPSASKKPRQSRPEDGPSRNEDVSSREKVMPCRAGSSGSSVPSESEIRDLRSPSATQRGAPPSAAPLALGVGDAACLAEGTGQETQVKAQLEAEKPPPAPKPKREPTERQAIVERVVAAWRRELGKPDVPVPEAFGIIGARLKDGCTEAQLLLVPVGARIESERWPDRQVQSKIPQLFGSGSQVAKFVEIAQKGNPRPATGPPRDVRRGPQRAEDQGWEEQPTGGRP